MRGKINPSANLMLLCHLIEVKIHTVSIDCDFGRTMEADFRGEWTKVDKSCTYVND